MFLDKSIGFTLALFVFLSTLTFASAQNQTKTMRPVYVVASDSPRKDRAVLVASAVAHNQQHWKDYGLTLQVEDIVTVNSTRDTAWFLNTPDGFHGGLKEWFWLGNACNETKTKFPLACDEASDPDHRYVIFLEVDASAANPRAAAAANFGASVYPGNVINAMEAKDLRAVGSIGHEWGHNFGHPAEPDCSAEGPVKSIMCNGGYYPMNRIDAIDFDYMLGAANTGYFNETPEDFFNIADGMVLSGAIGKTLQPLDRQGCAAACLKDSSCTGFMHFNGNVCEFKAGKLRDASTQSGFTAAEIKIERGKWGPLDPRNDPTDDYFITTRATEGDVKCLRGRDTKGFNNTNGAAVMTPCVPDEEQSWTLEPFSGDYYRLRTRAPHSAGLCLEGNGAKTTDDMGGAAFLAPCGNFTGQLWRLRDAGDGYYNLQAMFYEPSSDCLEGNSGNSAEPFNGTSHRIACGTEDGQKFKFVRVGRF